LLKQWECINFAKDWKRKGQLAGGKLFKTRFTRLIYEAHTGRRAPVDNESTKEEKQLFKQFRTAHEHIITTRNYLLEMYELVRVFTP